MCILKRCLKKIMLVTILYLVANGAISELKGAGRDSVKYIVKDGEALGKIYIPEHYTKATQFAVRELQLHIKKMTGAKVKMSWANKGPVGSGFGL